MANLYVAWVKLGRGTHLDGAILNGIHNVVSSEVVSFTSTSAQSSACPSGANAAIVKPDADSFVVNGDSPTASSTNGVHVGSGFQEVFKAVPGQTKIAARTVA